MIWKEQGSVKKKVSTQAIVAALGVGNLTDEQCLVLELTGELKDDTPIAGEDVVRILKKGNSFGYGHGNGFGFGHGNGFGFGRGKGPKNK